MSYDRAALYVDVCFFLKEGVVTPGSGTPRDDDITQKEFGCAELLLSLHGWRFASWLYKLEVDKIQDATAADPDPVDWLVRYKRPPVLKMNWVSATGRERDRLVGHLYDVRGAFILSNYQPLYLEGVDPKFANEANYAYWPRAFGKAVASQIADELSATVTGSRSHSQDLSQRTQMLFEQAVTHDQGEHRPPSRRPGSWVRSRAWGSRVRQPGERL